MQTTGWAGWYGFSYVSSTFSMCAAGNCYDNAFMESCFGTIKTELQLVDYAEHPAAVRELSEYIRYDNFERRHSAIDYDTPIEFERSHAPGDLQIPLTHLNPTSRNKQLTCTRNLKHLMYVPKC